MSRADNGLAARAAWLSHKGGHKQDEIAARLDVSRAKVARLIAEAERLGLIRVFVDGTAAECADLEDRLIEAHGLARCVVVPDLGEAGLPLAALSSAGARFLMQRIDRGDASVVGVGHGRTLAATVQRLPRLRAASLRFVSLLGSLTRHAAANPFDVIHRLTEITGAESYFLPAPFFVDTEEAKAVMLEQQSVRDVFDLAARADLCVVGIGEVGTDAHVVRTGMITPAEMTDLAAAGAVGEVLGRFVDARGRPVEAEVNRRAIGVPLESLRGRETVAIAGGPGKAAAIKAILNSGVLTGLITDEATAGALAAPEPAPDGAAPPSGNNHQGEALP